MLDLQKIRADFPILHQQVHGKPLVYLDNGATSQKPRAVIDARQQVAMDVDKRVHRMHAKPAIYEKAGGV